MNFKDINQRAISKFVKIKKGSSTLTYLNVKTIKYAVVIFQEYLKKNKISVNNYLKE